ncbi:MAG TPA: hypothetical protein VL475_14445 [Planctomycetaceae bacterium]|jgi:hypothetical protein|nr:hypothetical protein [Planctomycetaceae bacterium]
MAKNATFDQGVSLGQAWIAKAENSIRRREFVAFVASGTIRSYSIRNITEYRAKVAELAAKATSMVAVDEFWKSVLPTRDLSCTRNPNFLRGFIAGCVGRDLMESLPP